MNPNRHEQIPFVTGQEELAAFDQSRRTAGSPTAGLAEAYTGARKAAPYLGSAAVVRAGEPVVVPGEPPVLRPYTYGGIKGVMQELADRLPDDGKIEDKTPPARIERLPRVGPLNLALRAMPKGWRDRFLNRYTFPTPRPNKKKKLRFLR